MKSIMDFFTALVMLGLFVAVLMAIPVFLALILIAGVLYMAYLVVSIRRNTEVDDVKKSD